MGSQAIPPSDVFEQLTPLNLTTSLRSEVCPLCGSKKEPRRSICLDCWNTTPRDLARQLSRPMDRGYDRAMLAVLRHHSASLFILPNTFEASTVDRLPISFLRGGDARVVMAMRRSAESAICPKCCCPKESGDAICETCRAVLRSNMVMVAAGHGGTPKGLHDDVERLLNGIDPARLSTAPGDYGQSMYEVLRWLKARVFTYPM